MQEISNRSDKPEIIKVTSDIRPEAAKVTAQTNGNNFSGNLSLLLRYGIYIAPQNAQCKSF